MRSVSNVRGARRLGDRGGRPVARTCSRFAVYGDRRRNWHLFVEELEQWSRRLTTAECQAAFDGSGVPCSRYRTVEEAMDDSQLAHRHAFGEVRDSAGVFRALYPPFRFSAARASVQPYAATLGEHGNEVLAEAGYTAGEIEEYRKSGVLG
jgi:CoA:oxalate CoA-transferase